MRAMTTTRRPGERAARESAARRPRPNVERPLLPAAPELLARMSGLPRGAHDLADEALWTFGAPVSVPDATGPNIDLVVAYGHWRSTSAKRGRWRSMTLNSLSFAIRAPAGTSGRRRKTLNPTNHMPRDGGRGFYLAIRGSISPRSHCLPSEHAMTNDRLR